MKILTTIIISLGFNISIHGQEIVEKVSSMYSFENDWFFGTWCNRYDNDSIGCITDSVLVYTPIKYFMEEKPQMEDTLWVLGYSSVLREINEPKIYNNEFYYDIIRFSWFKDTLPVFYRLEKKEDIIKLNYKKTSGKHDLFSGQILVEKSIEISSKDYNKLIEILDSGDYWGMNEEFGIVSRSVLIESYINNEYYFINKHWADIKIHKTNKKILRCFNLLEKMIRE